MATVVAAEQWPDDLRRERSISWTPLFMNESTPPTISGFRQVYNKNGGGLWRAAFNSIVINSRSLINQWHALEAVLAGGLTPIDVPLLLRLEQPYPLFASGRPNLNSDITITTTGSVAARATSMTIDIILAGTVEAGQHFSVHDAVQYGHRMYRITTVSSVTGQPAQRAITFWPPLRFALSGVTALQFRQPRCVMTLETSDAMMLELELRKRGSASATFRECE